jgi:uncharacterized membrane protein YhiD involved in acid resistance
MNQILSEFSTQINDFALLRALLLGISFGLILNWIVSKFSHLAHSKGEYFFVYPVLIAVMILVITIIKTSLALSLGLVGALSIVRFRTPVKEPEELIYLFFAIAIGLGLGAGQLFPTSMSFAVISLFIIGIKTIKKSKKERSFYFEVSQNTKDLSQTISTIESFLTQSKIDFIITRIDTSNEASNATFHVFSGDNKTMTFLAKEIGTTLPQVDLLIIDNPKIGI